MLSDQGSQTAARRSRLDPVIVGICLAFVAWASAFIRGTSFVSTSGQRTYCLFDDAMVSMRYAWNLTHGLGLVWNVGERVEGYTNPLMTLLMAGATLVASQRLAVLIVQAAGVVTLLAGALMAACVAGQLASDSMPERTATAFRRLAFLGGLAYYPLSYWTLMGMETGLLSLALLTALWFFLRYDRSASSRDLAGFSLASGLAYLARPDALIATATLLALILFRTAAGGRGRWLRLLIATASYAAVPAAHVIWRWAYYGQLVPNTYVLKLVGFPLDMRLANGTEFVWLFFQETWLAVVLGIAAVFVRPRRGTIALASVPLCLGAYQIWAGGDAWRHWRLLAPAMPIVFILVARLGLAVTHVADPEPRRSDSPRCARLLQLAIGVAGTALLVGAWQAALFPGLVTGHRRKALLVFWGIGLLVVVWTAGRARSARVVAALLAVAAVYGSTDLRFVRAMTLAKRPYQVGSNIAHVKIAEALDEVLTPEGSVGVVWAGAIPYYTRRPAVDFLGKTDARVAAQAPHLPPAPPQWGRISWLPGHEKYDLEYSIRGLRPTYLQRCRWGVQNVCDWVAREYVAVSHRGMPLLLRRGAREVNWDRLRRAQSIPPTVLVPEPVGDSLSPSDE